MVHFGKSQLKTRHKHLLRVVVFFIWKQLRNTPGELCHVEKKELVELLESCSGTTFSPESHRRVILRVMNCLNKRRLNIIDMPNGSAGPYFFKVHPANIDIDLDLDGISSFLKFPKIKPDPGHHLGFKQLEMMQALHELNFAEQQFQKGRIFSEANFETGIIKRIKKLYSHTSNDIKILSRLVIIQVLIRNLEYKEAKILINFIKRYIIKNKIDNKFLIFKSDLYRAWLHFRVREFQISEMILIGLQQKLCDDGKTLAHYYNLFGLIERERAMEYVNRKRSESKFDLNESGRISLNYHQKALLLQMQSNDMDGLQNTCTSIAASYFFFSRFNEFIRGELNERTAFSWLISSIAINRTYSVGGYSVHNVIVLANEFFESNHDYFWLKRLAEDIGESAFACFEPYKQFVDFLEHTYAVAKFTKNTREQAYLLESMARFCRRDGDEKKALKYATIARQLYIENKFLKRAVTMMEFLSKL